MSERRTGVFRHDDEGRIIVPVDMVNLAGEVIGGKLGDFAVVDYTGDGTNSREIEIGFVPDFVLVVTRDNYTAATDHLGLAWAIRDAFGVLYELGASVVARHVANASGNAQWLGIVGSPSTKIRLGSNGASTYGTNLTGVDYRVLAFKLGNS